MIEYLRGEIAELTPATAIIEYAGVGYETSITLNTYSAIQGRKDTKLFIYEVIREDTHQLFGFSNKQERELFLLLISVSGIGPKAAMSILSHMTPDSIAYAIFSDDKKTISKAPGVGPKTAARIILELKDKVKGGVAEAPANDIVIADVKISSSKHSEAIDALTVLGFHRSAAEEVLKTIDVANTDLEDIIREALKKLMK